MDDPLNQQFESIYDTLDILTLDSLLWSSEVGKEIRPFDVLSDLEGCPEDTKSFNEPQGGHSVSDNDAISLSPSSGEHCIDSLSPETIIHEEIIEEVIHDDDHQIGNFLTGMNSLLDENGDTFPPSPVLPSAITFTGAICSTWQTNQKTLAHSNNSTHNLNSRIPGSDCSTYSSILSNGLADETESNDLNRHLEIHNYSSPRVRPDDRIATVISRKLGAVQQERHRSSSSGCSSASSSPNSSPSASVSSKKKPSEIKLTEEEKRMLQKEGYVDFPVDKKTLTKSEEKILRKVRRKIRNKRSAQSSRLRKKQYLEELEKKFQDCCDENKGLRREICSLKKQNENLLMKMKKMLSREGGQASFSTSLFVLFLSFLFILVPFLRPDGVEDGISGLSSKEIIGTGRHLLFNDLSESNGSDIIGNLSSPFA